MRSLWDFSADPTSPWPTQTTPTQRYLYNGKELNKDFGLNWYDYGARWYDAGVGRWGQVDPAAEAYYPISPFVYVADNPIIYIDPNGEFLGTLVGAVAGGVVNAFRGESVLKGIVSGAAAGAVLDLTIASGGTFAAVVAAGAASGAVGDLVDQTWDIASGAQKGLDLGELGLAAVGAVGGAAGIGIGKVAKVAGKVVRGLGRGLKGGASWLGGRVLRGILRKSSIEVGELSGEILDDVAVGASRGAKTDNVVSVFRVYGGKAKPDGYSWTPVNPNSVSNFRDAAGLPNANTGQFVIEGNVSRIKIIKQRSALPLDGNKGGLPEYLINPQDVAITRVSGANPEF